MLAGERVEVDAAIATGLQNGEVENQDRQVFGNHHQRQNPRREVDLAIAEKRNAGHRHQRIGPPGQDHARHALHGAGDHATEHAIQGDLQDVVCEHRQHRRRTAGQAAQATGGKGVETAGVGNVTRHGGVTHRECHQHQQGQDQQCRVPAVAQHDADREAAGDHTERTRRGNNEEDDEADTQAPRLSSVELLTERVTLMFLTLLYEAVAVG